MVDTGDGHCRCLSGRSKDVEGELFYGENVLAVDVTEDENESVVNNDDDLKICESEKQIHQLQMIDIDLLPYMQYHSQGLLPEDQKVTRKTVLESQHYEMINGVLHHENPKQPGRWCVVVPTKLRSQLFTEAHAGCFGGHFSEKKVYDQPKLLVVRPKTRCEEVLSQLPRLCYKARTRSFLSTSNDTDPCERRV